VVQRDSVKTGTCSRVRITTSAQRQTPLAAALSAVDERPEQVRTLLIDAEQPDVAARVQNADLCNAARQIRFCCL